MKASTSDTKAAQGSYRSIAEAVLWEFAESPEGDRIMSGDFMVEGNQGGNTLSLLKDLVPPAQAAKAKDAVLKLGRTNHCFVGQIGGLCVFQDGSALEAASDVDPTQAGVVVARHAGHISEVEISELESGVDAATKSEPAVGASQARRARRPR